MQDQQVGCIMLGEIQRDCLCLQRKQSFSFNLEVFGNGAREEKTYPLHTKFPFLADLHSRNKADAVTNLEPFPHLPVSCPSSYL